MDEEYMNVEEITEYIDKITVNNKIEIINYLNGKVNRLSQDNKKSCRKIRG